MPPQSGTSVHGLDSGSDWGCDWEGCSEAVLTPDSRQRKGADGSRSRLVVRARITGTENRRSNLIFKTTRIENTLAF